MATKADLRSSRAYVQASYEKDRHLQKMVEKNQSRDSTQIARHGGKLSNHLALVGST